MSEELSGDDLDEDDFKKFICKACKKEYKYNCTLTKHVKKVHPNELSKLAPRIKDKKTYKYTCDQCTWKFNNACDLRSHKLKMHGCERMDQKLRKCALCHIKTAKKEQIAHYKDVHDIEIDNNKMYFDSYELFLNWKTKFEKDTKAKFVRARGRQTTNDCTKHYFECHRSGHYISKGNGERHLKTQGSYKINGFCPAKVNVVVDNTGKCISEVTSTHVGHVNDLGHLSLSKSERNNIATKMASKVSFEGILDDIRDSISESGLERIHLLTKKDLYNIENSFNLHSTVVRHKEDGISIESWVHEMGESEKPCVLFYKAQGTSCSQSELQHDDFLLIIMNDAQCELLKKYGSDCICVDSTHGTNGYDFELTTLLVVDDMRQGFPCSFMISNRSDTAVLTLYFSLIRERTGVISPKVFMSDMAEAFFNAWSNVMNIPHYKLYCSWHIDRAWRKNLVKIRAKEKQQEVYKILRTLLEETDESTFKKMLKEVVELFLNNDDTKEFGLYFLANYTKCAPSWAYCHRLHCGLNTNMHLERMHGTIKYIYLKGTHCKRLDKSIAAIMKFLRDKLVDRLITLHKGKLTSKLTELRKRHKTSLELSTDSVIEDKNGWVVSSSSSKVLNTYHVEKLEEECTCKLFCEECKACLHKYQCTCIDSSIKWNVCKHIHLVCRYFSSNEKTANNNVPDDLDNNVPDDLDNEDDYDLHMNCENESNVNETEAIIAQLRKTNKTSTMPVSVAERLDKIKSKFMDSCATVLIHEQVDALEKMLAPLDPTLAAVYADFENSKLSTVNQSTRVPHNKKIQPQRRLFSVKKAKRKPKNVIVKPTEEESHKIALALTVRNQTAASPHAMDS